MILHSAMASFTFKSASCAWQRRYQDSAGKGNSQTIIILFLRFVNLKKELRPAVDVEFLVQLCQMFLDCDLGDSEFIGDFLVRPAIPDAADDQLFSWCQRRLLQCFF